MLSSNVGEVLLEPTEYSHNKTDFELINSYINKSNIKDNLTVIMEATSIYHKAPERFFKENNYHVIVFNPLIGKEITNTIRKTKTDKQDCIKLTNLFWKGSIPDRNYTEDEIYTRLNELSRQYYHLDEGLTRHKNRYKELLHLCFPEFEHCFKDGKIYDLTALNFIKEFPHAYIIKDKRVDALAYNMANTNNRHLNYYKRKAITIKEYAQNSYPGVNQNSNDVDNLKQLVEIIINLTSQKDTVKNHKRIIFNGNGYSDEWVEEAEKRGLLNLISTPDCLPYMLHEKNISLYVKHKVYSETEIKAHYEIKNEKYCKYLNIEVLTMIDMAKKDILPCVSRNIHELADTLLAKRAVCDCIDVTYEEELVKKLSALSTKAFADVKELEELSKKVKEIDESDAAACFYKYNIIPVMNSLRAAVDEMETLCSSEHWCYPSYGDLLFSVR